MELEFTTVKELRQFDSTVREQPIEADVILPEYFPAVGRILRSFVEPTEESVAFADGRVSVAGTAAVRLLYADDEGGLHCYQTETKYTKILPTECRDEKAAVKVTQEVRSLNCRALGPRRVEIKAGVCVRAELWGVTETAAVCGPAEGDLQMRTETAEYAEPICVCFRNFTENDSLRCEAGGKKLRTVIAVSAVPVVEKLEAVSNKLMVRGQDRISLICAAEDGTVGSYELSAPFSEVLDCYGVNETAACHVLFTRCEAEVLPAEEPENTFETTVRHTLLILAETRRELVYASDAYSLRTGTECRFSEVFPAFSLSQETAEERITAELEAFDEGGFTIRSVFVSDVSCSASDAPERGAVDGSLCFNTLVADGGGRCALLTKTVAFSHPVPQGSRCIACDVTVRSAAGEAVNAGTIALSCVLSFSMLTRTGERVRMLTEVREREDEPVSSDRKERAVVYFAEKGESLWNIAKENRAAVAALREMNGLTADIIESDTRLVFSCF